MVSVGGWAAESGTRTRTSSRTEDFKSSASTVSPSRRRRASIPPRAPRVAQAGLATFAAFVALVPAAAAGDRPYVELHGSRGALDPSLLAPAGFDRVELVTEVDNHLAVEVRAVRLVLTLITRDALGGEAAISGWQL